MEMELTGFKNNCSINKIQSEFLVDFMWKHEDLAKGQLKTYQARQKRESLWAKLAESLNEKGPPLKEKHEWRKTWSDMKYKAKGKLIANKLNQRKIGGSYIEKRISDLEEQIIQCSGLDIAIEGIKSVKEFGAPFEASEVEDIFVDANLNESYNNNYNTENNEDPDSCIADGDTRERVQDKKKEQQEHMKKYGKSTEEISISLQRLVEIMEENQNLLKKKIDIEEKMFKLKLEKFENDRGNEKQKLTLKRLSLEIKKEEYKLKRLKLRKVSVMLKKRKRNDATGTEPNGI